MFCTKLLEDFSLLSSLVWLNLKTTEFFDRFVIERSLIVELIPAVLNFSRQFENHAFKDTKVKDSGSLMSQQENYSLFYLLPIDVRKNFVACFGKRA